MLISGGVANLPLHRAGTNHAAPAMYRATRPQLVHFRVTCACGGGGVWLGLRSMRPAHEGQLSGDPLRSFEIRCSACAGLYVAGRGLRMYPPKVNRREGEG